MGKLVATVSEPKPGQLWAWQFPYKDGSWPFQRVTSEARHVAFSGGYVNLKRGSTFVIVVIDDSGPYVLSLPKINDIGQIVVEPHKRWHVAMACGGLIWVEHGWLEYAELITDAE